MRPLKFLAACLAYATGVVYVANRAEDWAQRIDAHFFDRINPEEER